MGIGGHKLKPVFVHLKDTPVMAGRKSSLLTAKRVLLIAVTKAEDVVVKDVVSSLAGFFWKIIRILTHDLIFAIVARELDGKMFVDIEGEGLIGDILQGVEKRSWQGYRPSRYLFASTSRCTFITVSRSVATTVSLFFSTSNKKIFQDGQNGIRN